MNKNILNSPLQQLRRMAMTLASIVAVVAVALMTACGSNDDPLTPPTPTMWLLTPSPCVFSATTAPTC